MKRASRLNARRPLAGAALLALAGGLLLLGRPGTASSPLTLKTIVIDGNVGDWDAVLANAAQTTHDGDGSSSNIVANCALYSTDRDCPLGGGAGNDLYTFAWTYDASYVYLYVERYGSASNAVDFFYVADTNQDRRLKATGDVVVHARWWGSTGNVSLDAGSYVPADTVNGDPIASPTTGLVDGYDVPGTNGTMSAIACAPASGMGVTTGADAGRKMEVRIPWCAFGVPAQQPFFWHVVATNNGSLNTPLDNIGAPSGGVGSFVQRGVSFTPDRSGAVLSPGSVTYDHTLRNDGNQADVFGFVGTSSQGAKIELLDGAVVIGRDDTGDGVWELTPQVTLATGASKTLQVRVTMPAGRSGQEVTRVTAASTGDASVTATATDTTHVGTPAFVPDGFVAWTQAGVPVAFGETLTNGQLTADTFDLSVDAGCAGSQLTLTADAAGTQVAAVDATGDGTWDTVAPAYDSNANGLPDLGPVAGQGTKALWLWVKPPAAAPNGACTVRLTATSPTSGGTARADHAVTVAPAVGFTPSYTRAAGTSLRVSVGGAVYFPAIIRNAESVPRAYALTQLLSPSGSGASARVWSDPNGDGNPADGVVITTTGTIPAFGGTQPVVVELLAGTAASGAALSLATTATATSGGATATQTSEADVGYVATFADALATQAAAVFPPCATVYLHGAGLLPNDTTSYSLTWLTPTATAARTVLHWPTTLLGTADDSYALPATAPTGNWTVQLVDAPSTRDQNLSFAVELGGSVSALTTDKARYRPGDVLLVTGAFANAGRASLAGGSFHYTLDGTALRTRSGVTVGAGGSVADPFTFTLPAGTAPGVRTISAGWWLSCGTAAFATRNVTFEVQPDPPVVTAPAAGAQLASSTPAISGTAVAFAAVTVSIDGVAQAPVTAAGDGSWSFTPAALADGSRTVTATQAVSGVASAASAAVAFTIDTTPPAVPTLAAIGSPTNANPVVAVVTAPGATTVAIHRDGVLLTSTPASVVGDVFTFNLALAEGTFSIQANAADALGNTSALSVARSVTVDRTPPGAPVVASYAGPTNAATVAVTATAAAGSIVRLYVDGVLSSTLAEGPAGAFTGSVAPTLDGSYVLTATAADAAGNVSVASAAVTLVIDRTPPAAPVVGTTVPLSPSQTNADPVPVTVTAEAGATVVLVVDGTPRPALLPTFTAPDRYAFAVSLATGSHSLSATATDAAGNVNAVPSNAITLDVDVTPPAPPTVQPIASPTRLQPVPVTVTAEAGSTVRLLVNGVESAVAPVSISGTTYAFELTLAEGSYSIGATAADALGNKSVPSATVGVVVDRTKPGIPTILSGIPTATKTPLVTVTGTAEAGSRVSATVTGTGLVPSPAPVTATAGSFSIDLDFLAAGSLDGVYQVVLRATDAAGNVSDPTPAASVTLDRVAPDAPVVSATPTSASPVVIHVSAEAGATVVLSLDGVAHPEYLPVSVIATDYSFQVPLANGGHGVTAVATDAAGNASAPSASVAFTVDSSIPATPTVSASAFVAATTFPVTVAADPSMTVVLYVGGVDSTLVPTASGGSYAFSLARPEGTYVLTAKARNGAGTWSAESAAVVVVVDTTAPAAAPTLLGLPALTNALRVAVGGATEPFATVTIRVATMADVTVTADPTGAWTASLPLPAADGSYGVTVQAADRAGNLSPVSTPVTVVVDRTAPAAAPTISPPLPARTNAASLTVAGTTEPNATVTIEVAGLAPVTTTADASGNYSTSVPLPTVEGSYAVTVRAADAAGNASPTSAPVTVVVDRTAPASAPTISPALPAITNATSLTVAGATEANATVTIAVTGMAPVTATADGTGAYTASVPLPATDGAVGLTVKATDAAGNASPTSAPVTVVVDRTAPASPPTVSPALPAITNATSLTVAGATEANATVTIAVTGMAPVTATADGTGRYSATVPLPSAEGSAGVTVKATDAAGNVSPTSTPVTVVVDRTPPASAPTISPALPSATNAASLTVAGATEANATVTIAVAGMAPVTATADGTGAYAASVPLPATDGTYAVTVRAADPAGNLSPLSAPVDVVVDRTGPATAPTVNPPLPAITNAASLTVAGATEANATVTIAVTGMAPVTTTADAAGNYSTVVALPATDGTYAVTVRAADGLGNPSPISAPPTVVVDRTGPSTAPSMNPLPGLTNATSVTVTGATEANATVTIAVTGMAPVTTTADAGGNYSVPVPLPAADGSVAVTARAADLAGNLSPVSGPATVVVDRTGPAAAPTVNPPLPSLTNMASVTVAGTTEPNATVTVLVDGALAVTTTADGSGGYSVTAPLPPADATYAVSVRANDPAGNPSPVSSPSPVRLDRTAPASPTIDAPLASAALSSGSVTVKGTAEPGATVTVLVDGAATYTATADATTGAWQVDVTVVDGAHQLSATATDPAGNLSAPTARSFSVATPPPAAAGGGGCGCGAGGASAPEGLLLVAMVLAGLRRRRRG